MKFELMMQCALDYIKRVIKRHKPYFGYIVIAIILLSVNK